MMFLEKRLQYNQLKILECFEKQGITIRKTIDVIIATFCIENSKPLLASDRDF